VQAVDPSSAIVKQKMHEPQPLHDVALQAFATMIGVLVAVAVGVSVGVLVGVSVGVSVGVLVGVSVGVSVGVLVAVLVGVLVGVEVALRQVPAMQDSPGEQQSSPHENDGEVQTQRRRPRESGSLQSPEQH
jgi:F0F1-type ATP synthase assembly protein I